MFEFSFVHPYQGEQSVQQILVFPHARAQQQYDQLMRAEVLEKGLDKASCIGKGAVYILRSVLLCGDGLYMPSIRCGVTGDQLWQGHTNFSKVEQALADCAVQLRTSTGRSFSAIQLYMFART